MGTLYGTLYDIIIERSQLPAQLSVASIALFLGGEGGEGPWDEASSLSVAICFAVKPRS